MKQPPGLARIGPVISRGYAEKSMATTEEVLKKYILQMGNSRIVALGCSSSVPKSITLRASIKRESRFFPLLAPVWKVVQLQRQR